MESLEQPNFAMLNEKLMEELLEKPWLGGNFSSRLWDNQKRLSNALNSELLVGLQQGKAITEIAASVNAIMGKGFNAAHRLVRTETMHYLNSAAKQGYKDSGVEYVQVWCAQDERTCVSCGPYHEKVYPIDKCPILPFHANCRCTYLPVTEEKKAYASLKSGDADFNSNVDFKVEIPGVEKDVLDIISIKSRNVASMGCKDGNEHMYVVDRFTGEELYYEKGEPGEVGGKGFFEVLEKCKTNSVVTIHNHSDNSILSLVDLNTNLQEKAIYAGVAAGYGGRMVCVADQRKKLEFGDVFAETEGKYRKTIVQPLIDDMNSGNITVAEFSRLREEKLSEQLAKDYFRIYRR